MIGGVRAAALMVLAVVVIGIVATYLVWRLAPTP